MQQSLFGKLECKHLPQEWIDFLDDTTIAKLNDIMERIDVLREHHIIYPPENKVFRIFQDLAPSKVRVVILGQNPYYNGNANGYAFGCELETSPSLIKIIEGIQYCYPNGQHELIENEFFHFQSDRSLRHLVTQGVMLLNTGLTVEAAQPDSHLNIGWEGFTTDVVMQLAKSNSDIIFVLWGAYAKGFKDGILRANMRSRVFTDEHPASAARDNRKWETTTFRDVNNALENQHKTPIAWL